MSDQRRNLNPHKPAIAAMWLYSVEYASQNGGCMDFWDSLIEFRRELCRDMVNHILEARDEDRGEL